MLTVTMNRQAESVLLARGQAGGGKDRSVSGETEREGRGQIETETEETETVEGERQGRGEAGLGRKRQSWGWVMEGRGGRMSPSCCQGHTCVMSHFAPCF